MYGYVILKDVGETRDHDNLRKEINQIISLSILGRSRSWIRFSLLMDLPKTRSGKIMRRILRKIAHNEMDNLGDISTLLNPEVVQSIIEKTL